MNASHRNIDVSHHGFVNCYGIAVSQMTTDMFYLSYTLSVLSSFMTYRRFCIYQYTTSGTSGAGTAYPSGAPEFTHGFLWGSCFSISSFMCNVFVNRCFCFLIFLITIVLNVLWFTDCDYTSCIFKLFLYDMYWQDTICCTHATPSLNKLDILLKVLSSITDMSL